MMKKMLRVMSASRRVDLVGAYPDEMIRLLREKAPPELTHTLVIWTKAPWNMLHREELRNEIAKYRNLYVHLTVTGMGGSILEPGIPSMDDTLSLLKDVVACAGGPEHARLRFDPIVHIKMPDGFQFSNLDCYENVATAASETGIANISISWMQVYRKVVRHLKTRNMAPMDISNEQIREELSHLKRISSRNGITLHGCCVPVMPVSRCIDGYFLQKIHPDNLPCTTAKAKGQRELCGCTASYDIGWYQPCLHGCLYCYANPRIE